MMTDPVSDLLTRIRNGAQAGHKSVTCPLSRIKLAIAKVLAAGGFLEDVGVEAEGGHPVLRVKLKYHPDGLPMIDGLRRVSKPGCRVYVGSRQIPKVRNGLGISVLSTPKGVISDHEAREAKVGGEILCEVW